MNEIALVSVVLGGVLLLVATWRHFRGSAASADNLSIDHPPLSGGSRWDRNKVQPNSGSVATAKVPRGGSAWPNYAHAGENRQRPVPNSPGVADTADGVVVGFGTNDIRRQIGNPVPPARVEGTHEVAAASSRPSGPRADIPSSPPEPATDIGDLGAASPSKRRHYPEGQPPHRPAQPTLTAVPEAVSIDEPSAAPRVDGADAAGLSPVIPPSTSLPVAGLERPTYTLAGNYFNIQGLRNQPPKEDIPG